MAKINDPDNFVPVDPETPALPALPSFNQPPSLPSNDPWDQVENNGQAGAASDTPTPTPQPSVEGLPSLPNPMVQPVRSNDWDNPLRGVADLWDQTQKQLKNVGDSIKDTVSSFDQPPKAAPVAPGGLPSWQRSAQANQSAQQPTVNGIAELRRQEADIFGKVEQAAYGQDTPNLSEEDQRRINDLNSRAQAFDSDKRQLDQLLSEGEQLTPQERETAQLTYDRLKSERPGLQADSQQLQKRLQNIPAKHENGFIQNFSNALDPYLPASGLDQLFGSTENTPQFKEFIAANPQFKPVVGMYNHLIDQIMPFTHNGIFDGESFRKWAQTTYENWAGTSDPEKNRALNSIVALVPGVSEQTKKSFVAQVSPTFNAAFNMPEGMPAFLHGVLTDPVATIASMGQPFLDLERIVDKMESGQKLDPGEAAQAQGDAVNIAFIMGFHKPLEAAIKHPVDYGLAKASTAMRDAIGSLSEKVGLGDAYSEDNLVARDLRRYQAEKIQPNLAFDINASPEARKEQLSTTVLEGLRNDPAANAANIALQKVGNVYVAGGGPRNVVLGKPIHDNDLMISGATPDQVQAALASLPGKVDFTGKNFGVFRYRDPNGNEVEVALARTDQNTGPLHTDTLTDFNPTITAEQDAFRRDFTGNSILIDTRTGEVLDPTGGLDDLSRGVLHTVNPNAMQEDPLRILRAVRFAANYGLELSPDVESQIRENISSLSFLPKERIQGELVKMVTGDNFAQGIETLNHLGALDKVFPELADAVGFDQKNIYHNQELFSHMISVATRIENLSDDPAVRMAALLHDIGKPQSQWIDETGNAHYHQNEKGQGQDHEEVGANMVLHRLGQGTEDDLGLKFPNDFVERVRHLVQWHMFPPFENARGARRFMAAVGGQKTALDLLDIREADGEAKGSLVQDKLNLMRSLILGEGEKKNDFSVKDLAVNGKDIMEHLKMNQGVEVGQVLQRLLQEVIDNPELNNTKDLLRLSQSVRSELHGRQVPTTTGEEATGSQARNAATEGEAVTGEATGEAQNPNEEAGGNAEAQGPNAGPNDTTYEGSSTRAAIESLLDEHDAGNGRATGTSGIEYVRVSPTQRAADRIAEKNAEMGIPNTWQFSRPIWGMLLRLGRPSESVLRALGIDPTVLNLRDLSTVVSLDDTEKAVSDFWSSRKSGSPEAGGLTSKVFDTAFKKTHEAMAGLFNSFRDYRAKLVLGQDAPVPALPPKAAFFEYPKVADIARKHGIPFQLPRAITDDRTLLQIGVRGITNADWFRSSSAALAGLDTDTERLIRMIGATGAGIDPRDNFGLAVRQISRFVKGVFRPDLSDVKHLSDIHILKKSGRYGVLDEHVRNALLRRDQDSSKLGDYTEAYFGSDTPPADEQMTRLFFGTDKPTERMYDYIVGRIRYLGKALNMDATSTQSALWGGYKQLVSDTLHDLAVKVESNGDKAGSAYIRKLANDFGTADDMSEVMEKYGLKVGDPLPNFPIHEVVAAHKDALQDIVTRGLVHVKWIPKGLRGGDYSVEVDPRLQGHLGENIRLRDDLAAAYEQAYILSDDSPWSSWQRDLGPAGEAIARFAYEMRNLEENDEPTQAQARAAERVLENIDRHAILTIEDTGSSMNTLGRWSPGDPFTIKWNREGLDPISLREDIVTNLTASTRAYIGRIAPAVLGRVKSIMNLISKASEEAIHHYVLAHEAFHAYSARLLVGRGEEYNIKTMLHNMVNGEHVLPVEWWQNALMNGFEEEVYAAHQWAAEIASGREFSPEELKVMTVVFRPLFEHLGHQLAHSFDIPLSGFSLAEPISKEATAYSVHEPEGFKDGSRAARKWYDAGIRRAESDGRLPATAATESQAPTANLESTISESGVSSGDRTTDSGTSLGERNPEDADQNSGELEFNFGKEVEKIPIQAAELRSSLRRTVARLDTAVVKAGWKNKGGAVDLVRLAAKWRTSSKTMFGDAAKVIDSKAAISKDAWLNLQRKLDSIIEEITRPETSADDKAKLNDTYTSLSALLNSVTIATKDKAGNIGVIQGLALARRSLSELQSVAGADMNVAQRNQEALIQRAITHYESLLDAKEAADFMEKLDPELQVELARLHHDVYMGKVKRTPEGKVEFERIAPIQSLNANGWSIVPRRLQRDMNSYDLATKTAGEISQILAALEKKNDRSQIARDRIEAVKRELLIIQVMEAHGLPRATTVAEAKEVLANKTKFAEAELGYVWRSLGRVLVQEREVVESGEEKAAVGKAKLVEKENPIIGQRREQMFIIHPTARIWKQKLALLQRQITALEKNAFRGRQDRDLSEVSLGTYKGVNKAQVLPIYIAAKKLEGMKPSEKAATYVLNYLEKAGKPIGAAREFLEDMEGLNPEDYEGGKDGSVFGHQRDLYWMNVVGELRDAATRWGIDLETPRPRVRVPKLSEMQKVDIESRRVGVGIGIPERMKIARTEADASGAVEVWAKAHGIEAGRLDIAQFADLKKAFTVWRNLKMTFDKHYEIAARKGKYYEALINDLTNKLGRAPLEKEILKSVRASKRIADRMVRNGQFGDMAEMIRHAQANAPDEALQKAQKAEARVARANRPAMPEKPVQAVSEPMPTIPEEPLDEAELLREIAPAPDSDMVKTLRSMVSETQRKLERAEKDLQYWKDNPEKATPDVLERAQNAVDAYTGMLSRHLAVLDEVSNRNPSDVPSPSLANKTAKAVQKVKESQMPPEVKADEVVKATGEYKDAETWRGIEKAVYNDAGGVFDVFGTIEKGKTLDDVRKGGNVISFQTADNPYHDYKTKTFHVTRANANASLDLTTPAGKRKFNALTKGVTRREDQIAILRKAGYSWVKGLSDATTVTVLDSSHLHEGSMADAIQSATDEFRTLAHGELDKVANADRATAARSEPEEVQKAKDFTRKEMLRPKGSGEAETELQSVAAAEKKRGVERSNGDPKRAETSRVTNARKVRGADEDDPGKSPAAIELDKKEEATLEEIQQAAAADLEYEQNKSIDDHVDDMNHVLNDRTAKGAELHEAIAGEEVDGGLGDTGKTVDDAQKNAAKAAKNAAGGSGTAWKGGSGQPPTTPPTGKTATGGSGKPRKAPVVITKAQVKTISAVHPRLSAAMFNVLLSAGETADPRSFFHDPRQWVKAFRSSSFGLLYKLDLMIGVLKDVVPLRSDRIALSDALDSEDYAERVLAISKLKPELQPVANAFHQYLQITGKLGERNKVLKDALADYLPHILRKVKVGDTKETVSNSYRNSLARTTDAKGNIIYPTRASLKLAGHETYDDLADILAAHGQGMFGALKKAQMLMYLKTHVVPDTGEYAMVNQKKMNVMNPKVQGLYRVVKKGSYQGLLDHGLLVNKKLGTREGQIYVYKPVADYLERMEGIYDKNWIGRTILFLNTLYKAYQFITPLHVMTVGSNISGLIGSKKTWLWGDAPGIWSHASGRALQIPESDNRLVQAAGNRVNPVLNKTNSVIKNVMDKSPVIPRPLGVFWDGAKIRQDPALQHILASAIEEFGLHAPGMENLPEEMKRVMFITRGTVKGVHVNPLWYYEHLIWDTGVYNGVVGSFFHLFNSRAKWAQKEFGVDILNPLTPRDKAARAVIGDSVARMVNTATGMLSAEDFSNAYKHAGELALLARTFDGAQFRTFMGGLPFADKEIPAVKIPQMNIGKWTTPDVLPGTGKMVVGSAFGRGISKKAINPENQYMYNKTIEMEKKSYRNVSYLGMMRLALYGTLWSGIMSYVYTGQAVWPWQNSSDDLLHTFDARVGVGPDGRYIYSRFPLFNMQREVMEYALAGIKGQIYGGNAPQAVGEQLTHKANAITSIVASEFAQKELDRMYSGYGDWNFKDDQNLDNYRQSIKNMTGIDYGSGENGLIYALLKFAPGAGTHQLQAPTSDKGQLLQSLVGDPQHLWNWSYGSRISQGPKVVILPDGTRLTQDEMLAQKKIFDGYQGELVQAAKAQDWAKVRDLITNKLHISASQASSIVFNGTGTKYNVTDPTGQGLLDAPQPDNGMKIPSGMQRGYGLTQFNDSILGHSLTQDQAGRYNGDKIVAQTQVYNALKSNPDFAQLDAQTQKRMVTDYIAYANALVEKNDAFKFGIRDGAVLSDAQMNEALNQAIALQAANNTELLHNPQYASLSQEDILNIENTIQNSSQDLVTRKVSGNLSQATWEQIHQINSDKLTTLINTKNFLQSFTTYQGATIDQQDQMISHYLSFANQLVENEALGKIESGFAGQLDVQQVNQIVQNTMVMEEGTLQLLHQSPLYQEATQADKDKMDANYANLARTVALDNSRDQLYGPKPSASAAAIAQNGFQTIESKIQTDSAYRGLMEQFGGYSVISADETELAAIKSNMRRNFNGNPRQIALLTKMIENQYYKEHPEYYAFKKAKTRWESGTSIGRLYSALNSDEFTVGADSPYAVLTPADMYSQVTDNTDLVNGSLGAGLQPTY